MSSFDHFCSDCGQAANFLVCLKKYGAKPKQSAFSVSTFHQGTCDICGETKAVTEARDYFYPTDRACKTIKRYLAGKEL